MTGKECKLGSKVRDTITGLEGTVVAKTEWMNGCWRITIQPNQLKDGKPVDSTTFDVEQLELIKASTAKEAKPHGGDRADVGRAPDPR